MEEIRVLLADDHPAFRLGLRVLLKHAPALRLVGEAHDGKETLALLETLQPDVVILDCELPGLTGTEVAREIRRQGWPTRVLALSAYDGDQYVRGMLDAGAVGYLLKDEASDVIVAAVQAAAQGNSCFSPTVASKIAAWARGEHPGGLTERELEVLRLVTEGCTNKEIAHRLQIVERTVQFHVHNILRKLDVASRVEIAVWARNQGIG